MNLISFVSSLTKTTESKGAFHRGHAAFKFVKINETGYEYNYDSIGCHEYHKQAMIKSVQIE